MLSSQTNYLGSPINSAETDDLKPLGLNQTLLLVDDVHRLFVLCPERWNDVALPSCPLRR